MGHPALGNRLRRHLSRAVRAALAIPRRPASAAAGDLSHLVDTVPADARVGGGQTDLEPVGDHARWDAHPEYLVFADGPGFPLLDAAAADLDELVFRQAPRVVSKGVSPVCLLRRARATVADLRPANPAVHRLWRDHALDAAHRRHRKLQLLQSADHRAGGDTAG